MWEKKWFNFESWNFDFSTVGWLITMMNNLFKAALQGVVQRMATPENIQSTFQFVSERFVQENSTPNTISRVWLFFFILLNQVKTGQQ